MSDQITNEDAAQTIYNQTFTDAGGDDKSGKIHGPQKDYMDMLLTWYRNENRTPLQIQYEQPARGVLDGFLLRHPSGTKKTAIVIHGVKSSADNVGPFVRVFYEMGFNVFTPTLRGHGSNEAYSNLRTMGIYDSRDIFTWIGKLQEVIGQDLDIVLMGYSLGGAIALQAGSAATAKGAPASSSTVRAVIDDCGYPDLAQAMIGMVALYYKDRITSLQPLPPGPPSEIHQDVDNILAANQKVHFTDGITTDDVKAGNLPLLVTYGSLDDAVFPVLSQEVYNDWGGTLKLSREVDGAGHMESICFGYVPYRETIRQLLVKANILPCALSIQPDPLLLNPDWTDFPAYAPLQEIFVEVPDGTSLPDSVEYTILDHDNTGTKFVNGATTMSVSLNPTGNGSAGAPVPLVNIGKGKGRFCLQAKVTVATPQQCDAVELRTFAVGGTAS